MLKHQKKSWFKSLEAVHSMKEKRQNPYYPAAATVYSNPLCNPQIMVRLLILRATSGNNHSQWSCPLSHHCGAMLVRAQLSVMMYDSLSAVSLLTHHKWRHKLVFRWKRKNWWNGLLQLYVQCFDCVPLLLRFSTFTVCYCRLNTLQCNT